MGWLNKLFGHLPQRHATNSNSGKTFEEQYQDLGAFRYDPEGFAITYGDFTAQLRWKDITQINVYKADKLTVDEICMDIVRGDRYFTITEELPGWYQFVLKTKEIFPQISKDWDLAIIQPPFATNFRTIYERNPDEAPQSGKT
jgi:hypothetical protein